MAKIIKFILGLLIVLFGESIDVFRKAIFKYHGPEPKWFVWWVTMKARLSYRTNWFYWIIGAIVCAPIWFIICAAHFIWDAFIWVFRLPFRRRQNAAIA